jgi:hypothetical protein
MQIDKNVKYPCDKSSGEIRLPHNVLHELFHVCHELGEDEAVKRLIDLTGADLKAAKVFVAQISKRR